MWRTIEEAERIGFEEVARYGFPHFGTALKSREVSFMCGDRWVITLRCCPASPHIALPPS